MSIEVVMPRLGWTMDTGRVVEWLKHDGDAVTTGELLFSVESDKAVIEVESLGSGVLRIPPDSPSPDVDVPVGAVVAYLLGPGEAVPWEVLAPPAGNRGRSSTEPSPVADLVGAVEAAEPVSAQRPAHSTPARTSNGAPTISPRARRIAAELDVDWTSLEGSGRSGRIVERDIRSASSRAAQPAVMRVTPTARSMAAAAGIDVAGLAASKDGKHVTKADVQAVLAAQAAPERDGGDRSTPLSAVRRIVARRMSESAQTAAAVTLTTEADATELVRLRARSRAHASGQPAPSYNDFLVRLVGLALLEHPRLNATWAGDTLIEHAGVHIGLAVDSERGLVVPVVRDAHRKSVGQIAAEAAPLIERARQGRSAPDELSGGTFTITNLGMFDIQAFTPIINLPECAILGVGSIVARVQVVDEAAEQYAVRKMLALSLTFDHRVVDGAPAARFLQQVKRWIEQPFAWLLR